MPLALSRIGCSSVSVTAGRTLFDLFEDITVHGEAHLAVWSEPSNGEFEGILVGTLCPTELCLFAYKDDAKKTEK